MLADTRQIVFFSAHTAPQIKVVTGLRAIIGGAALAQKLRQDFNGLALALGPLTGAYPATGVAFVAKEDGLWQLGADFILPMRLFGFDGAVGLDLSLEELSAQLTRFLTTREEQSLPIDSLEDYETLYNSILERVTNLWVSRATPHRTCPTCPHGCGKNLQKLTKINLSALLGACQTAASIYNDSALAFAALRALGYDYTHEELEAHEENNRR